jgi:hypothetical protein
VVLREFYLTVEDVFFELLDDTEISLPVPERVELDDDFVF